VNLLQKMWFGIFGGGFVAPWVVRQPDRISYDNSAAGEEVTPCSVLGLSAVWACVNLISGTIASLPCSVYRTGRGGSQTIALDHPLYRLLHDSPNFDQTALDFWEYMTTALELWGSAYAVKVRDGARVVALNPIRPDIVTVRREANGQMRYRWTEDGRTYDESEQTVFHIRGFGGSPLGGMSTLSYGCHTFGLAQAADRAAAGMFRNGLRSSGALAFEQWLTPEQRLQARDRMVREYSGAMNAGKPMVLEGNVKWTPFTISPDDAQMLESRAFSVEDICRFFSVPPHMIGHTEKQTSWGSGLEQQTLGFLQYTLRRRLKRIEQAAEKQLRTPQDAADGIRINFEVEGLLRADSAGRAAFYKEMSAIGAMTINEIRALEGLPSVPGGNVPRMQMQNVPITQAGQPQLPVPGSQQ
jgi:HK97 family phage portal protein